MSEIQNQKTFDALDKWVSYDSNRADKLEDRFVKNGTDTLIAGEKARDVRTTEIFRNMDSDKSGTTSKKEFQNYATEKLGLSKKQADNLFKSLDSNGNGSLGWKEVNGSASPKSLGLEASVQQLGNFLQGNEAAKPDWL